MSDTQIERLSKSVKLHECQLCEKKIKGIYDPMRTHLKKCHPDHNITAYLSMYYHVIERERGKASRASLQDNDVNSPAVDDVSLKRPKATGRYSLVWTKCPWCSFKADSLARLWKHSKNVHSKGREKT